jgi:hypothetical protein
MSTAAADRSFTQGPLYKKLVEVLPTFVQEPFSDTPKLRVLALCDALKMSHEAVYKWLRKSRLTPDNATALIKLANTAENLKALGALERTAPTIRDFDTFVYGAA